MNAGERELNWIRQALPPKAEESCEDNWMRYAQNGSLSDQKLIRDWDSVVPGSLAPCHLVIAAIQCMRNKGYDVTEAEKYIDEGLEAVANQDGGKLQVITAKIYNLLNHAPKDEMSSYWKYKQYKNWEEIAEDSSFPEYPEFTIDKEVLKDKVKSGWYGQLIGGALGTQIEGYTTANIQKVFGKIQSYLRKPETYNDDITYELAFLVCFSKKGYEITSSDIADSWLELIADGYSAEEVALNNLRKGIFPPESGIFQNYYSDWIGVQMRASIHGMVTPGNPKMAAKMAVIDGVISHSNSGLLGGVFNAVLVSMAYVETDMRKLLEQTIACIPKQSEFYKVIEFAHKACRENKEWTQAWALCEDKFKDYNWIHAYPNVAAEIVALWFGENDFDKTAYIIMMAGYDVDCNAAPVLNVIGIAYGMSQISEKWTKPLGTNIKTIMRKYKEFGFEELCEITTDAIMNAIEKDK